MNAVAPQPTLRSLALNALCAAEWPAKLAAVAAIGDGLPVGADDLLVAPDGLPGRPDSPELVPPVHPRRARVQLPVFITSSPAFCTASRRSRSPPPNRIRSTFGGRNAQCERGLRGAQPANHRE